MRFAAYCKVVGFRTVSDRKHSNVRSILNQTPKKINHEYLVALATLNYLCKNVQSCTTVKQDIHS